MRVDTFASAQPFLARIEPELGPGELEHHLLLGVAHGFAGQPTPDTLFLAAEESGRLKLAALLSPNRPLLMAANGDQVGEALTHLASWLSARGHQPRAFIADVPHAEVFAREWMRVRGSAPRLRMRQRLHALTRVEQVATARGGLRPASSADMELLARWQAHFNREALGESLDPELREALGKRVENGEMYLWTDGEPRSMAASARPTRRGIAINSVYTPPEWRGHGYATASVAALSQRMLDYGKEFCVLYTDLANPTSNAIYARIGYRPIADSLFYDLTGPAVEA